MNLNFSSGDAESVEDSKKFLEVSFMQMIIKHLNDDISLEAAAAADIAIVVKGAAEELWII